MAESMTRARREGAQRSAVGATVRAMVARIAPANITRRMPQRRPKSMAKRLAPANAAILTELTWPMNSGPNDSRSR